MADVPTEDDLQLAELRAELAHERLNVEAWIRRANGFREERDAALVKLSRLERDKTRLESDLETERRDRRREVETLTKAHREELEELEVQHARAVADAQSVAEADMRERVRDEALEDAGAIVHDVLRAVGAAEDVPFVATSVHYRSRILEHLR